MRGEGESRYDAQQDWNDGIVYPGKEYWDLILAKVVQTMSDFKDTQMILEMAYNGLFAMRLQAEQATESMKEECKQFQFGYVKGLSEATEYIWRMHCSVDNGRQRRIEEYNERCESLRKLRGADNE